MTIKIIKIQENEKEEKLKKWLRHFFMDSRGGFERGFNGARFRVGCCNLCVGCYSLQLGCCIFCVVCCVLCA